MLHLVVSDLFPFLNGVQEVAGWNPAVPTGIAGTYRTSCTGLPPVTVQAIHPSEHT